MRQIFSIAVVALSAAAIASGQQQGASRDPKAVVEQVIRKLDNERIQAQIHADAAALERIYAEDFIGVGPSGAVRTKPQVISDFTSGDLKFQSKPPMMFECAFMEMWRSSLAAQQWMGKTRAKQFLTTLALPECG